MVTGKARHRNQHRRSRIHGVARSLHGISHVSPGHHNDHERESQLIHIFQHDTDNPSQYALPINAFVWLFTAVFWFAWGKKKWPGLNVEVIDKVVADSGRDTKE